MFVARYSCVANVARSPQEFRDFRKSAFILVYAASSATEIRGSYYT
jgi:hypothetical protein